MITPVRAGTAVGGSWYRFMRIVRSSFFLCSCLISILCGPTNAVAHYSAVYDESRIIVVFRGVVKPIRDEVTVPPRILLALEKAESPHEFSRIVPEYTNDAATNTMFATLGVARLERLFQNVALPSGTKVRGSCGSFWFVRACGRIPCAVIPYNKFRGL